MALASSTCFDKGGNGGESGTGYVVGDSGAFAGIECGCDMAVPRRRRGERSEKKGLVVAVAG